MYNAPAMTTPSFTAPLEAAVGIGTLVEHSHGLVGRADLYLQEVRLLVLALAAVSCRDVM